MACRTRQGDRGVVVTGIGQLSPAGNSLEAFWKGITSERSAIRAIRQFDTSDMPIHSGDEVDQEELERIATPAANRSRDHDPDRRM